MSADRNALVDALKAGADALALALLGEPNRLLSNKSSWRYGRNGSFVLEVAGSRRGLWFSHEDGEGGGPLELIRRERGLDVAGAFRWARDWLGGSFQEGDSRPSRTGQRPTSPTNDNRALETKGDPAADARLIMLRSEAVAGTLAEVYLRRHRGIDGLLPESLRFIPSHWSAEAGRELPALVVPAFEGAEIRRTQLVFLDPRTGAKALNPKTGKPIVKRTFGKLASHIPAVFTGQAAGARFDVVLTEGPEDAIALWSVLPAGEVATVLGKGNLGKPEIAQGTCLLIVADNDPNGGGLQTAQKAAVAHTLRGCQVSIAVPPTGIKDTNELLLKQGPDAVRAMVEEAERFQPAPAEGAAVATLSAGEAAELGRQAVARFIERALAWQPEPEPSDDPLDFNSALPAPVVGVRGSLGLGKTQHILEQLVRPEFADKHVSFYAPEHRLNGELLERFRAMAGPDSPRAIVIYGREQTKPDGTVMCQKSDLVRKIAPLKVNIQSHLCERRRETGEIDPETGKKKIEIERCEFFERCSYQQQRADKGPGVRFLSHAHLFIKRAVPRADINIIDESFWQGALHGTDVRFRDTPDGIVADGGYCVSLGSLQLPRRDVSDGKNADLVDLSQRCAKAIYAGGTRADFAAVGVTAEAAVEAMAEEYKRLEKLAVSPAMPRARQEAAIMRYREQEARRFARLFGVIGICLDAGSDPCADSLELVRDVLTKEGLEDRVYLYWRAAVRAPKAPTLLLDANLEPEIARHFFPALEEPIIAEARLQGYHATQILDHSVPKSRLAPLAALPDDVEDPERRARHLAEARRRANRRGELRRLVEVEAAKGETVCITYKSAREAIEAEGKIPNASFAHWNALRGHDQWRDVDSLIVAGVPQPSVEMIERMGRALCHGDPKPIETIPPDQHDRKRYKREPRLITMADGTTRPVEVDVHVDRRCTLLLDQIRAETMQAIGRARLVHRDPAKPCKLIILTSYPLPLAMHKLSTWNGEVPDPLQVLMARGIVPDNKNHAAVVLKDIFPEGGHSLRQWLYANPAVAERWDECVRFPYGESLIGESDTFARFRYRLAGERKSAHAWINLHRHPDPSAALEAVLGPLNRLRGPRGAAPPAGETEAAAAVVAEPPAPPVDNAVEASQQAIAEAVGVDQSAVARWTDEFMRISAANNFIKPHDFTAPAPEPEPPAQHPPPLSAAARQALLYLRLWNYVVPLPDTKPDLDYEDIFIRRGTAGVLAVAFAAEPEPPPATPPPKPPLRQRPLSPLAPDWARRAMGYPVISDGGNASECR